MSTINTPVRLAGETTGTARRPSGPRAMHPGGLLTLAENVAHEVEAVSDASFLIAVAAHTPIGQA